nr:hypothetical protein [Marinicella sp. W31]MDC2877107.1 hypothetical protein [Marinicella sp. W31]
MWQFDTNHCPTAAGEICRRIVQLQLAAMFFNDLADNRKTKPRAFFAHCNVRFKDHVTVLDRQAFTAVYEIDDVAIPSLVKARPNENFSLDLTFIFRNILNSFCSILYKISEGLAEHSIVERALKGVSPNSRIKVISVRPISRRNTASARMVRRSPAVFDGFGMRAKDENSSTMRPMSPT